MAARRTMMAVVALGLVGVVVGSVVAMASCDVAATGPTSSPNNPPLPIEKVRVGGKTFKLELADNQTTRFKGLSDRTVIAKDGGMLFVFPQPIESLHFVMRDCPIPIDIIFLDASGRITAMHAMVPEEPRRPDEPKTENPLDDKYEARLKRYPSRYAAQFAIELAGGAIKGLSLKEGDRIDMDLPRLKKAAK